MSLKSRKFRGNSEVTSFDELQYFTGITEFTSQSNFNDCKSLVSINLSNIIRFGDDSYYHIVGFDGCAYLNNVILSPLMDTVGGCAFRNCTSLEKIDLSHVRTIYRGAFDGATSLKDIGSLANVETINERGFKACKSLKIDLSLPSLKGTLGGEAFFNSGIIRILDLGKVEVIGTAYTMYDPHPFRRCESLLQVTLPDTVKSICYGAFWECTALQWVKILAVLPPAIKDRAFENTNNCPIYVPAASVDAYKSALGWSNYASRIQPIID